jgi:ribonuclease PH
MPTNANPTRRFDRKAHELRPITFETDFNAYAEGSCLVKAGGTHVLCTASVDAGVPPWLLGKGRGWVTAEYSMLPRATHTRSKRDREKISGRTHEIQRLIGRALRSMIDLKALGERQILIDCDVLQADGGTRTASINGACIALSIAVERLQKSGAIPADQRPLIDTVSAISVGLTTHGQTLTDLDYEEDSSCGTDMNIVMTGSGKFIEVQGTAEKGAFTRVELDALTLAGEAACAQIRELQKAAIAHALR